MPTYRFVCVCMYVCVFPTNKYLNSYEKIQLLENSELIKCLYNEKVGRDDFQGVF